jgi:hypothetical protein
VLDYAQGAAVVGPLEAIHGRVEHAFDVDLYLFEIFAPAEFSAAAIQLETGAPNLQLFLFNQLGQGVVASDNALHSQLPEIPTGTLRGRRPGVYLLGVSPANDDPVGALGKIFPDVETGISEPTGLARFDALLDWTRDLRAVGGDYAIVLTGAAGVLEPAAGDYNLDGTVNLADYTLWRDTLGAMGPGLAADGDGSETVDTADYAIWKTNFGMTAPLESQQVTIPEPTALALFVLCAAVASCQPLHSAFTSNAKKYSWSRR